MNLKSRLRRRRNEQNNLFSSSSSSSSSTTTTSSDVVSAPHEIVTLAGKIAPTELRSQSNGALQVVAHVHNDTIDSDTSTTFSNTIQSVTNQTSFVQPSTRQLGGNQFDTSGPFLSTLSSDLHHHLVTHYLDWASITALRLTHPYFAALLQSRDLTRLRKSIISDFLYEEACKAYRYNIRRPLHAAFFSRIHMARRDKLAALNLRCYGCLELKGLGSFSERMCIGGLSLGGKRAEGRMCKICCVERGRVRWGVWERENDIDGTGIVRLDGVPLSPRSKRWGRVFGSTNAVEDNNGNWPSHQTGLGQGFTPLHDTHDEGEIGVCARCRKSRWELWWGCRRCFEKEERRRQQQDRIGLNRLGATVLAGMQKYSEIKEDWHVFRLNPLDRGRGAPRARLRDLRWVGFGNWMQVNREDWRKWKRRRAVRRAEKAVVGEGRWGLIPDEREQMQMKSVEVEGATVVEATYIPRKAYSHHAREIRCSSCWIPNCPRRRYSLGLAHDFALEKHQWCDWCQDEHGEMLRVREARREREHGRRWSMDGLGCLFDGAAGSGCGLEHLPT